MKNTKRSVLVSGLCLLLTAVMLMGSTFAWFTDSVTNEGNKIEAGTLNVDLLMDKEHNGNYVSIADETEAIFSDALGGNGYNWEPGMTQVVYLAVQNNGSLALNYNFILDVVDNGLVGSLEYAVLNGTKAENMTQVKTWEAVVEKAIADMPTTGGVGDVVSGETAFTPGRVLEKGETAYFAMAVHMKEDADNQYQKGSVTIDVKLLAKQAMSETDGFGNSDYDQDAGYSLEVGTAETFLDAIATLRPDQTLTLTNDITFDGVLPASTSGVTNIDLNGHTLTATKTDSEAIVVGEGQTLNLSNGSLALKRDKDRGKRMPAFSVQEDAVLNLTGVDYTCDGVAISVSGNALAVNVVDSKISASSYALQTVSDSGDRLVINLSGSEFKVAPDSAGGATGTMILVDSPVRFNMQNCQVESAFHSVILRGAQAVIENSRLVNTVEGDSLLHFFDNRNWGSENMVNLAAITLGNKGDGFQYPTTCTLVNTQVVSQGVYPAIYAYGNTGEGLGVTLTHTDCTITGEVVKGNDAVVVNP